MESLEAAPWISIEIRDRAHEAQRRCELGDCYRNLDQHDKGVEWFDGALENWIEIGDGAKQVELISSLSSYPGRILQHLILVSYHYSDG